MLEKAGHARLPISASIIRSSPRCITKELEVAKKQAEETKEAEKAKQLVEVG